MKFFIDCRSISEAKEVYRKLAKVFHPDKGGDAELFRELTTQFDNFSPQSKMYTPNNMGSWQSSFYQFNSKSNAELEISRLKAHVESLEEKLFQLRNLNQLLSSQAHSYRTYADTFEIQYKVLEKELANEKNKTVWNRLQDWWNDL